MSNITCLLSGALLVMLCPLYGQALQDAEVRISYAELQRLLEMAKPPEKVVVPAPALRSVRMDLREERGRLVMLADVEVFTFGEQRVQVPLIDGGVVVESVTPADAVLVMSDGRLCLSVAKQGAHRLGMRILPVAEDGQFRLSLPACPSALISLADGMDSVAVSVGQRSLAAGESSPVPAGAPVVVRLLDEHEVKEANQPEQPSGWTWQNRAVVMQNEDSLFYAVIVRASADGGSGVSGFLRLPKEAMEVRVDGDEELVSQVRGVDEDGVAGLRLQWKTRGVLERRLQVFYKMPLRPLDRQWVLEAPGGESARSRFLIVDAPMLTMAAPGLSGLLDPQGLPGAIRELVGSRGCREIEGGATVELEVTRVPVVVVEELTVNKAEWTLQVEPDGAMLATGLMDIEHQRPVGLRIETPKGMKLLSCEVGRVPVPPAAMDGGWLKVPLEAGGGKSQVRLSFTGRVDALDPVEGTLDLELPMVAHFIRSLDWKVEIPGIYQAEVHGNLTRVPVPSGKGAHVVSLVKNLCRDERPNTRVFYQRSDLKP